VGRPGDRFAGRTIDLLKEDWSSSLGAPDEALRQAIYLTRAYRALSTASFDVVHDHNESMGMAFAAAGRSLMPVLATLHGPIAPLLGLLLKEVEDSVALVGISRAQQRQGAKVRWAGMVYNAVETTNLPRLQSTKGPYLIQLARINPDKGQHIAIETARRLGLKLLLAGKVDPMPQSQRYFRNCVQPHLGARVTWIPDLYGPAKSRLLAGARAMLFPLQWEEPFGLAMVEAMVVGTPVIAFRRGAAPELVDQGLTGYVVKDVEEMVLAAGRVDQIDSVECARWSRARFNASVMARNYEQVYLEVIARRTDGLQSPIPPVRDGMVQPTIPRVGESP
jgi:glycosyltransferase involved in cell wall biosynthesis